MTHKRRKKKQKSEPRAKGRDRAELLVVLAKSDATFEHLEYGGWLGQCLHCRAKLTVSDTGYFTDATIEHIVPLAKGGSSTDLMNMSLACTRCNNEKGIRHDHLYPHNARSVEVVENLLVARRLRWREPVTDTYDA